METETSYLELSNRSIFRFSGPDAERYLNGQISQSIKLATEHHAVPTCITNAKGKLQGIGFIRKHQNAILLDAPESLREILFQRLDQYIIADDVTLEDISDSHTLFHVLGQPAPAGAWECNRLGVSGYDTLSRPQGEKLDKENVERLRITHGVPAWGSELDETTLPPEALLDSNAISYSKGCYTGQEVISRMKSAGKLNRKLTSFALSGPLEAPCPIPNPEDPTAKPAGHITSVCSTEDGYKALGFVNRKWLDIEIFHKDEIILNTIPINPVR